jgi:hypothetical protein
MNQPTRHVLLVGEHLDGHWIDAPAGASAHRVMKPMTLDFNQLHREEAGVGFPVSEFVDYRIERMPIAIRSAQADVWIGVASTLYGPDRDLAIVHAIFQRDVAQQFKEAW